MPGGSVLGTFGGAEPLRPPDCSRATQRQRGRGDQAANRRRDTDETRWMADGLRSGPQGPDRMEAMVPSLTNRGACQGGSGGSRDGARCAPGAARVRQAAVDGGSAGCHEGLAGGSERGGWPRRTETASGRRDSMRHFPQDRTKAVESKPKHIHGALDHVIGVQIAASQPAFAHASRELRLGRQVTVSSLPPASREHSERRRMSRRRGRRRASPSAHHARAPRHAFTAPSVCRCWRRSPGR